MNNRPTLHVRTPVCVWGGGTQHIFQRGCSAETVVLEAISAAKF